MSYIAGKAPSSSVTVLDIPSLKLAFELIGRSQLWKVQLKRVSGTCKTS